MAVRTAAQVPVVSAGVIVADHLCTPISHVPAPGELVIADDLVLNIGGGAANVAVDLARLGVRSAICGKVGDDAFGQFARDVLSSNGIDTQALRIDPDRPTSQTLIVNVRDEDRRFIHCFGANDGFTIEDLDAAIDPPPRVLFIGYFLIIPELTGERLAPRLERLRREGTTVVLDVACPGSADYLAQLRPVLPHTDVFLPNSYEAALILGETDPIRQAEAFRQLGARRVVITQGAEGVVSLSGDLRVRLGSYPVTFVDGTGGGDAFDAGYIAGLLDGLDELSCLKLASAVGASCVRAVGTTAGVFSRPLAESFIAEHEIIIERI